MQNSEWLRRLSIILGIILLLMFLYGLINLEIMNLENKKNLLKKEFYSLTEEKENLEFRLEEARNPEILIKRAVKDLGMKNAEVIFIDDRNREEGKNNGE